jgi:Core-2/I-Branching enzyme
MSSWSSTVTTNPAVAAIRTPGSTPTRRQPPVPFQSLQRAGYRIDRITTSTRAAAAPAPVPPAAAGKQHVPERVPIRHICLLAVTIDELPYEDIWKQWANSTGAGSTTSPTGEDHHDHHVVVSLVCHAKFPHRIQSNFLQQHLLQEPPRMGRGNQWAPPEFRSHRPEWGSIEILRAMLDILHDGLQIGRDGDGHGGGDDEDDTTAAAAAIITDDRYHPKRYLITPTTRPASSSSPSDNDNNNNNNKTAAPPQATKIPPADMFVFISETCIPIQPLSHWLRQLDATRSWVNGRHRTMAGTPRNKYELDQFANMRLVPAECRWKADQWLALCRSHAIAVREIDNHLPEQDRLWRRGFHQVNASDEMYFPTALAILHLLQPDPDDNNHDDDNEEPTATTTATATPPKPPAAAAVEKRPVTYTDWSRGMKNPATFTNQDLAEVVTKARAQGCLVARKFTGDLTMADWEQFCNNSNSNRTSTNTA